MAIHHANPLEIIHLQPLGSKIGITKTHTLFKTDAIEAIRLVMPAGKKLAEHKAPGEITVQCLKGCIKFTAKGAEHEMNAGDMLYLEVSEPHAVEAVTDASVLLTILLSKAS
ncbi:cupin domain-containing protein [Aporhodopirellula aestuarii]|uniref:Cupin domain-containing protein n=1 Tax=Aporhodopirellula aestuarii TaxID=2950107 RepID=A0ABT0TZ20_9BACT|nr:cupin domain-containing protein [Aporhodopirellula aestuarii]MCM2369488.1 cupin domain-containing protein [Aporhodopirellula aestuarii]